MKQSSGAAFVNAVNLPGEDGTVGNQRKLFFFFLE
jgi:hypothetical protein